MRTVGGLLSPMLARENLLRAVHEAARGNRAQPAVQAYLARLDDELARLHHELAAGEPRCGGCQTFLIHDPKQRLITAPVFRERVLHHAVMNVCGPVLDRRLVHHTYACRVGKGTFAALEAAQAAARGAPWFLKLDVRRYFASIPHMPLFAALGRVFREAKVRGILEACVSAYATSPCGLAIGTLVSQHLANFYLAVLDTFILQELRPAGYVRYMDDLALWFVDKGAAISARDEVLAFARGRLELEFKTAFINAAARGMDFLGHRVFPSHLSLNRAGRARFRRHARGLDAAWQRGGLTEAQAQQRATALAAFTARARSRAWRRRVLHELEEGPQAGSVCCAAAVGSTTAGTPDPPSATATRPRSTTTTSVSVPVPAPAAGRSALMEQAPPPARRSSAGKPATPRRWPVAGESRMAASERERRGTPIASPPP